MTELLAPAGNMEALKAAIANGCDAVYLGMQHFGARAYSSNFDENTIKEAVEYAHLRNVKVYVTMNTIVFEDEIENMKKQVDILNEAGADGIIVQDLAVLDYVSLNYEDMEVHCSTQMGIDDLEGTLLCRELGADRVVMARETDIEKVMEIRKKAGIPIEIFGHGALCVSYSGNCLMSGLIGYRSGNRGRCVGSCRKLYELRRSDTGESFGKGYYLSTKDLKTIEYIDEMKKLDSLKIEGRMKESVYVANVIDKYRKALDGKADAQDSDDLKKTFNRTYTRGYLFGEDKKNISNILRPNNYGYEIGKVAGQYKGMYELSLNDTLNQNDIIRIDHDGEDINLSVVKLYDKDGMLISSANASCFIRIKEKLSSGDIVYKTKDYHFYKSLEGKLEGEYRRFPLDMRVYAYPDSKLVIDAEGLGCQYLYESTEILNEAKNNPTTKEQVIKQLARLNDTVFEIGTIDFEEYNAFIPAKMLNAARRDIVSALYNEKLGNHLNRRKSDDRFIGINFEQKSPYLTASVMTKEQCDICKKLGIKEIYYDNIVRRNDNEYKDREGTLLIGGYGGILRYRKSNDFVTDYSLNVVNSRSCHDLFKMGAKRVTLSYELNKRQIKDLCSAYVRDNGGMPALEMIVYGRAPLMFTKYCPLKKLDLCGKCKEGKFELTDEYGTFPVICHDDCNVTILNGRILNLLDEIKDIEGIEAFRLAFTTEDSEETERVVIEAYSKLTGEKLSSSFCQETDTRGHFNKEII